MQSLTYSVYCKCIVYTLTYTLTYVLYPNLHLNIFPKGYSDVVPLFRIFSSMLTFSTVFLQKARGLGKIINKQKEL